MNTFQSDFIKIIGSALINKKYEIAEDFDFQMAFDVAQKHGIPAIIYYGALNCGFDENNRLMQMLFNLTCKCISRNVQQSYEISRVFEAFNTSGIEYMPLKGILLNNLYPKSEMRIMSDADILIKLEQYEDIRKIMFKLGFKECGNSDHEMKWSKPSLYVELHNKLIPSYNKDYFAYYGDGWRLAKVCQGTRYSMTDEDQMIYLFTHFAKHYRDAGIGFKHILDLWVYRKNFPNLDERYIRKELKKLRLYDFYVNIMNTLAVWFNGAKPDKKTDFITDYIFECGAAGKKENYMISDMLKNYNKLNFEKNGKLKMYFFYLFFPYEKMCMKYHFLKKFPFALPIMWIVRLICGLFDKQKRNSVKSGIDSIPTKKIVERRDALNFVGLDFNFKE